MLWKNSSHSLQVFTVLIAIGVLVLSISGALLRNRSRVPASPQILTAADHYQNGIRLARAGNSSAAETEWQTSIGLDPDYPPPYFALASLYEEAGNLDAAVERLQALRRANASAAHVECRLADFFTRADRFHPALIHAKNAIEREPDCPTGHLMLGMILASGDELKKGVKELEIAHKLLLSNKRITLSLAQVMARAGKPAEAIRLVEPLLSSSDVSVQANYMMGLLLSEYDVDGKRDYARSQTYLREAIRLDPNHPASNAQLGIVLTRLKQYREARTHLELAGRSGGLQAQSLRSLAIVYSRLGLPDADNAKKAADAQEAMVSATRQARRRLLFHPDDRKSLLACAGIEMQRGHPTDALDLMKSVLRENPDDPEALAVLQRITSPQRRQPSRTHSRSNSESKK